MLQIEQRHRSLARDLGVAEAAELEQTLRRAASHRVRHPAHRRSQRPAARAGDGHRRADGDASGRRVPAPNRGSTSNGWTRARCCARRNDPTPPSARAYLSATCNFEPDPELQRRLSRDGNRLPDAGIHRQRRAAATPCCSDAAARTPRAATSRRSSAPAASRSGPTCPACSPPTRAPCRARACCARSTTTRHRRSRAAAPRCCTRAASCLVKQYGIPLYGPRDADARARGHGDHGDRRRRRRAGQGGLRQEGHHARRDGDAGHVAPGRLPRRCLRGVQGARTVDRPGLDVRDERDGVARPGRQRARRRAPCSGSSPTCHGSAGSR